MAIEKYISAYRYHENLDNLQHPLGLRYEHEGITADIFSDEHDIYVLENGKPIFTVPISLALGFRINNNNLVVDYNSFEKRNAEECQTKILGKIYSEDLLEAERFITVANGRIKDFSISQIQGQLELLLSNKDKLSPGEGI